MRREKELAGFAGTAYADLGRDREVYIEYRGGGRKFIFLERSGTSYFSDNEVEERHSGWLLNLAGELLAAGAAAGSRFVRAGFALAGGRLRLGAPRPARAFPALRGLLFKFENECRYNYHYSDLPDADFNAALRGLGVKARFRTVRAGGENFVRFGALEPLEKELEEKSRGAAFAAGVHEAFLAFILGEAKKVRELGGAPAAEQFAGLRRLNAGLAVHNYLSTRALKFTLAHLRDELGAELFGACHKSFLASLSAPAGRALRGVKSGARARFEALRRLVSLKNAVNDKVSVITRLYTGRLSAACGLGGSGIAALCRLPAAAADRRLRGGPGPRGGCQGKAPTPRLAAGFPLRGRVAKGGRASGAAKLFRDVRPAGSWAGRILVTDQPDGEVQEAVRACAGVITARGGLTSRAAVLAVKLGKPCLVDVFGCADILRDGDRLTIGGGKVGKL